MFPFQLALNGSTLFPFKLNVMDQIQVAAEAGYAGIELWMKDIETYVEQGGQLQELRKHLDDSGLKLINAIAFFPWSDKENAVREQGLDQAQREADMLAQLGCTAIAAPPFGDVQGVPLDRMAENFAVLTEKVRSCGLEPVLEFWGRANVLSRLSEAVYVAMESGVSNPKILLDPFHMYTGGSHIDNLSSLSGQSIGIVHVNDYPATPTRDVIEDRHRVFPGEGIAPNQTFARLLHEAGYSGYLSLELFMEDFGNKSALDVARIGVDKIHQAYRL